MSPLLFLFLRGWSVVFLSGSDGCYFLLRSDRRGAGRVHVSIFEACAVPRVESGERALNVVSIFGLVFVSV